MVRVRDNGIQVCRHPSVLRQGRRGAETDQEGYRHTTARVGQAEEFDQSNSCEISEDSGRSAMFVRTRSLESPGCSQLLRVQPVSDNRGVVFEPRVIVNKEIGWSGDDFRAARIRPWITAAVDRARFHRRIANF